MSLLGIFGLLRGFFSHYEDTNGSEEKEEKISYFKYIVADLFGCRILSKSLEALVKEFVTNGVASNTHPAKLLVFSKMLDEIFGVNIEDIIPGIEKKLGSKILGLRGSVDLLFSGVIIELKVNLEKEWGIAKNELIKYFQCLKEERPEVKFVAIATDLKTYRAFLPKIENGVISDLIEIGSIKATTATPTELIIWLDSFIFSSRNQQPTAEDLKIRFGAGSPTYALATQEFQRMLQLVKNDPEVALKRSLWSRTMQIVYGKEPQEEVFVDHSYVVTLVKLIVYLRLSGAKLAIEDELKKALNGEYFRQFGIPNLIEEDFFTWILDNKISKMTLRIVKQIVQGLLKYDLSQIDEDLFKEIYQQIVRQGERHRVGEYYTPEWLCQLITDHTFKSWLDKNSGIPCILDPACGSGTFITNAIHYFRQNLLPNSITGKEALKTILDNVMGMDINPLAVTIARANYILALGSLIQYARNINIPIYNADSIRIPAAVITMFGNNPVYDLEIDGKHIQLPTGVSTDRNKLGVAVSGFREALKAYSVEPDKSTSANVFRRMVSSIFTEDEITILLSTLQLLMKLEDAHQDSIWVFMINNLYAPLFMKKRQCDILISNPPWIVMRSIDSKLYQDFLKKQVFKYDLLKSKQIKLFTQMEMATLFFRRTSDLYLREGGDISFLMPISVISAAEQHESFKLFKKPSTTLKEILNFEYVTEIFSLPVCVLIGSKGGKTSFPVPMKVYQGKISSHNKNAKLSEVELTFSETTYSPPVTPKKAQFSPYYKQVRVGASIFPRVFWFVEFIPHPSLRTIDPLKPLVKTSEKNASVSKKEWKDIRLQGNVENEFIYATLLGKDTIPFGHLDFRPVVLPINFRVRKINVLSKAIVEAKGAFHFAGWYERSQKIWIERRTEKSTASFPNVEDRLNYQNLLSIQDPSKKFIVLYNARGANSLTCVVDRCKLPNFIFDHSSVEPKGFVADYTTYTFETNDEEEAHYLCSFLNSRVIHKRVKSFQPRGKYGKRDIGRRPFKLSIPKFSRKKQTHIRLSQLSKQSHQIIIGHTFTKKGFRGMRNEATALLKTKIDEIDSIVDSIL